ncbi:MAG: hypothetical protein D3907_04730 [Candidatus Electrothrix sp. AUS3]|nr:hypothetical protein [Candidatus Electrothrix gigas]
MLNTERFTNFPLLDQIDQIIQLQSISAVSAVLINDATYSKAFLFYNVEITRQCVIIQELKRIKSEQLYPFFISKNVKRV